MSINGEAMGLEFLDGMTMHYGVGPVGPNAGKSAEMGSLATYVVPTSTIGVGTPNFSAVGMTGAGAAAAIGTDSPDLIEFMNGVYQYITSTFIGTVAGLAAPLDPSLAFDAGVAAYSGTFGDEQPLRLLITALINQLNAVTVVPMPPPSSTLIASIS